jgi:abequosyltransferase
MEKIPLISICIPTYNRKKYLKQCLDSIVNQDCFTENQIEIIISDNDSNDNTEKLVKEYQINYKNIKYFINDNNI